MRAPKYRSCRRSCSDCAGLRPIPSHAKLDRQTPPSTRSGNLNCQRSRQRVPPICVLVAVRRARNARATIPAGLNRRTRQLGSQSHAVAKYPRNLGHSRHVQPPHLLMLGVLPRQHLHRVISSARQGLRSINLVRRVPLGKAPRGCQHPAKHRRARRWLWVQTAFLSDQRVILHAQKFSNALAVAVDKIDIGGAGGFA